MHQRRNLAVSSTNQATGAPLALHWPGLNTALGSFEFFFFVCKIGHLVFLLLFPLPCHRDPRVALPCSE